MHERERGVTLIELLVSIAILGFLLAGIYGMLNTAYQSFLDTRRRIDSQQTARMVTNYLVYRLREIDGGQSTSEPVNGRLVCRTAPLRVRRVRLICCPVYCQLRETHCPTWISAALVLKLTTCGGWRTGALVGVICPAT